MSIKQCRPQYGGAVLKAGQRLSGKIHKANEIFNSLTAQVVSNMHDIKGLLDRIEELKEDIREKTVYSFEKQPLVNIPVKDMVDDNAHKCRLGNSELYNEIKRLEKLINKSTKEK